MLPAPLPVPFRLLPERRCFANVGVGKCYLLHPPAPAARMGTPSLPPPIAAIQNWWSWKAPPLVGTLRYPYGTLTGPLENTSGIHVWCRSLLFVIRKTGETFSTDDFLIPSKITSITDFNLSGGCFPIVLHILQKLSICILFCIDFN